MTSKDGGRGRRLLFLQTYPALPVRFNQVRMVWSLQRLQHTQLQQESRLNSPIQSWLEQLHADIKELRHGAVASYIPELALVDPDSFGICLVTMDGTAYCVGDTSALFTIQSISKPFIYATALAERGQQLVSKRVGVEPSGEAFNSISLDPQTGAPLNPMINAGAIASTSLVRGETPAAQWERIEQSLARFIGKPLTIDEAVPAPVTVPLPGC